MRIQKARYEPVHIAFEKLDQPVIRIEPAPFLAAEQLGGRKFLSSLYGEIFLQKDGFESRRGHSGCAANENYFVLNYSQRQWIRMSPCRLAEPTD